MSGRGHQSAAPAGQVGVVTIVLTLLGWSSVPLFLKHFSHSIDAWTSNGWRYGFSALIWAPVLVAGLRRSSLPAGLWRAAIVPSAINAAGQVCFTYSHYKIDPGLLTFGLRSQMLFVAVGAYLMFPRERPIIRSRSYLLGLAALMVGTAGVVLLGESPLRGAAVTGVILSIASGFFFAAYGLAVRRYMHGINSIIAFAAISQYTAAAMVILMLVVGERAGLTAADLPGDQIALLLLSAVVGIALGHVLYYTSIARLGVAVSSGVLQLHPFIVAIGSLILFDERLTVTQWVSGIVGVGGALLMLGVQRRVGRREHIDTTEVAIAEGEGGL